MHNTESVLENETHKGLWDFEIQAVHLISARRPDLMIVKKKKKIASRIVDFAVPANHRIKVKENKKKDKYLDLAREVKKSMEYKSDGDNNCNWCDRYSHHVIEKGSGGLGNKKMSGSHQDYSIIKIDQNTEESPVDEEVCRHSDSR